MSITLKRTATLSELVKGEDAVLFRRFPATIKGIPEHAENFVFGGLTKVLEDFGIGSFEAGQIIEWYLKACRLWAPQENQRAFNAYAKARIDDHLRYSRRRGDAWHIVDGLFYKARFNRLEFTEVIDALTFLVPTQPLPEGIVTEDGDVTRVDLTLRADSPKVLRIDSTFLPTLKRLYPFRRVDDIVVKDIPIGATTNREFKMVYFAWWDAHPEYDIVERGLGFSDGDRLNWTRGNLFDIAAEKRHAKDDDVPPELPECRSKDGKTFYVPGRPQPVFAE
jgi:hypothetical protein